MAKHKNFWRFAGLMCLVACLCVALIACGGEDDTTGTTLAPTVGTSTYNVRVTTVSGAQLKNLSVYVYTDATMGELETVKPLDENGCASFTASAGNNYVAVLMGAPDGYQVQEYYTFDSKNEANIQLTSSVITDKEKPADKNYALGDVMYDFTITASDGTAYTLSELLKEKDAVVLNFWYLNCSPCKIEFPYLEMAYAEYSDRIELLAINCEDGNDSELNTFKTNNELTFPLAIGDKDYWYPAAYTACPTTIVVDRYGMIVYMHAGYFDEVAPFNALFRLVTGDDYTQTLIQDIESLITEDDYRPDGSEERPYELGGVTEFDVKVPANSKVYYNLYRLMDVTMRIENKDAYVIVDGVTYYPVDGVIETKVSCEDTFKPVCVVFGNTSGKKIDVHVQFVFEPGNVNNPIELALGENEVTVTNVNALGVYYTYTAPTSGKLTITIQSCTEQAVADIQLYNHNTFESVYLAYDGVTDENGLRSVSIAVNAGDVIQIIFGAATEPDVTLSSVTIQALASIQEGEGGGIIDNRTGYSVSVVDQDGNPVPGVKISLSAGSQSAILTTDATGTIGIRLTEDAYFLELAVPSGYVADTTSYLWTPANTHLQIRIAATSAFSVQVQKPDGTGLANALVKIYSDEALEELQYAIITDANGALTFIGRVDTQYYAVLGSVEADLVAEDVYVINAVETVITLSRAETNGAWQLGDFAPNFTVTDIDGNVHTLDEMLQEKDVVVLTFWRTAAVSSVLTLSNLQKVYEIFGERMAVLALDPADQLEMELKVYRGIYNWTFPLALCDASLAQNAQAEEYPTTVIIDREGRVCLMHTGVISQGEFISAMNFYLSDDYVHTPFDSIEALLGHINPAGNSKKPKELEAE